KHSNVTLFVRREVAPAFGAGVSRLELRTGLQMTVPLGPAWALHVTGLHVRPDVPRSGPLLAATSDEAFASLGRRLGAHVELSGEARYRRRGPLPAQPEVEAFRAGVVLSVVP